jgi:hypothetical protein
MYPQETKPTVLARIPQITTANESARGELPVSRGRVIGQALSFRMLGTAVVVLVALAIVPYLFLRGNQPAAPSAAANTAPAWQPSPPASSADAAPVWVAPVAVTPKSAPATISPSPMPEVSPQAKVAVAPPPAQAASALMSPWPNPAHPASTPEAGSEEPRASANQSMAIRPSEYIGNSHDNTRPGVR